MSDEDVYSLLDDDEFKDVESTIYEGKNIPDNLHDICKNCIANCREKYNGYVDAKGTLYKDGFAVNCKFIPKDEIFVNKKVKQLISGEEFEELNAFHNALLWAKRHLVNPDTGEPWKPRSYQVPPAMCTAQRIVMRFGRRCLPAGTPILMADGVEKSIEKVKVGEKIKSLNEKNLTFIDSEVINFWENGEREIYRITLRNGMHLDCTANHPLYIWLPLQEKYSWVSVEDGLSEDMLAAFCRPDEDDYAAGFSPVACIEKKRSRLTYDIEVANTHNMVSNGIVSHNTGKSVTLSILMAWYLFTGGGIRDADSGKILNKIKILVVTPQKSQIDELFGRLRSLIYAVPKLKACLETDTKGSPQIIAVKGRDGGQGHIIKGFASGDASGSKGTGIRGTDANLIIVDEAAFVSPTVMKEVIRPILMTTPTTRMVWSSTPSGIAGDHFEEVCLGMPEYKEFYTPSTEMPNFELMKASMVREYGNSPDEWEREVEAKFPEGGVGVYKKALVRTAQQDYSYSDMYPMAGMVYTVGVDWNKEKGTEIVVVGTSKGAPFNSWVVLAEKIAKKDFSTPMGIHRLVEINRIWKPAWMYLDEGGDGSTCCQMLQFIGKQAAGKNIIDARLMYIVKAYDFGSKIEFRDFQGKKVKKPAKPFMVENSVRRLELGELFMSRHDVTLMKQMDNYLVVRRNQITGLPVYGVTNDKIGDHRLDALNLALVAIRLELPSLNSREVVTLDNTIRYVGNALNRPKTLVNDELPEQVKPRALNHNVKTSDPEAPFAHVEITTNPTKPIGKKRGLRYRGGRTWR